MKYLKTIKQYKESVEDTCPECMEQMIDCTCLPEGERDTEEFNTAFGDWEEPVDQFDEVEMDGDEPEFAEEDDDLLVDPMGTDLADFEDEITDDMDVSEEDDTLCNYCGDNPKEGEDGLCGTCHEELYGQGDLEGLDQEYTEA